jgi:hypothetical protein
MVRRRPHSCGLERALADAACSSVLLCGGRMRGIAPGSISAVYTGVLKTSGPWRCGIGLPCCARFFEGTSLIMG